MESIPLKKYKKENKPEDKELIDIFLNGGNCVKEENISEIIEYLTI